MTWSRVLTFVDPFQYTEAVRAADMQIFATTKGHFRAELTQVTMDELWMQRLRKICRVYTGGRQDQVAEFSPS